MSQVELVAITQPLRKTEDQSRYLTPEEHIVYCARVSNPNNQLNLDTAPKLLKYCIEHNHVSIFEQIDLTFEIKTSRGIAPQLLRHKSASFQEFCVAGDTEIYFDLPNKVRNNSRGLYKLKISDIYKKWNELDSFYIPKKNRLQKMYVRSFDESSHELIWTHISDVSYNGPKEMFEIELYNGKKIKCTKEHKFLSEGGFISLADGAGLNRNGNIAYITNVDFLIGCNGIPCYQNKEWLENAKQESIKNKTGLLGIAQQAGVSYHTIRKWLKIHNIQFSKKEVASIFPIWNKGKYGYKNKPHSIKTIEKMRKSAKKGPDSNLWKGGVERSERLQIADWCQTIRAEKYIEASYQCKGCGSSKNLELDHIVPVYQDKSLAYNYDNIQVLCHDCHVQKHKLNGDAKIFNNATNKNTTKLSVSFSKIKSVKYLGIEDSYDLEIDHNSHNYVANGIVVHNSQRYSTVTSLEPVELRRQGATNRQSSEELFEGPIVCYDGVSRDSKDVVDNALRVATRAYEDLTTAGVSKETARFLLPLTTTSTLYMKNNVRNWLTYLNVRLHKTTQKEHREIAEKIRDIFIQHFPVISEVFHNFETAHDEHFM